MLVGLLYDCICFIFLSNVVIFVSYLYLYLSLLFVFVQFMQFAISRRWPALGQTCGAKVQVADFRALTQLLTDRRATLKVKAGAVFLKTGEKRNTVIKSNVKKSLIIRLWYMYHVSHLKIFSRRGKTGGEAWLSGGSSSCFPAGGGREQQEQQ